MKLVFEIFFVCTSVTSVCNICVGVVIKKIAFSGILCLIVNAMVVSSIPNWGNDYFYIFALLKRQNVALSSITSTMLKVGGAWGTEYLYI